MLVNNGLVTYVMGIYVLLTYRASRKTTFRTTNSDTEDQYLGNALYICASNIYASELYDGDISAGDICDVDVCSGDPRSYYICAYDTSVGEICVCVMGD